MQPEQLDDGMEIGERILCIYFYMNKMVDYIQQLKQVHLQNDFFILNSNIFVIFFPANLVGFIQMIKLIYQLQISFWTLYV